MDSSQVLSFPNTDEIEELPRFPWGPAPSLSGGLLVCQMGPYSRLQPQTHGWAAAGTVSCQLRLLPQGRPAQSQYSRSMNGFRP